MSKIKQFPSKKKSTTSRNKKRRELKEQKVSPQKMQDIFGILCFMELESTLNSICVSINDILDNSGGRGIVELLSEVLISRGITRSISLPILSISRKKLGPQPFNLEEAIISLVLSQTRLYYNFSKAFSASKVPISVAMDMAKNTLSNLTNTVDEIKNDKELKKEIERILSLKEEIYLDGLFGQKGAKSIDYIVDPGGGNIELSLKDGDGIATQTIKDDHKLLLRTTLLLELCPIGHVTDLYLSIVENLKNKPNSKVHQERSLAYSILLNQLKLPEIDAKKSLKDLKKDILDALSTKYASVISFLSANFVPEDILEGKRKAESKELDDAIGKATDILMKECKEMVEGIKVKVKDDTDNIQKNQKDKEINLGIEIVTKTFGSKWHEELTNLAKSKALASAGE